MSDKTVERRSFDSLHEEILASRPEVRAAWLATEGKRKLAAALVGMRKRAGLSQKELADSANWNKAFVSRLESARGAMPSVATITRYAEACGEIAGLVFGRLTEPHLIHIEEGVGLQAAGEQAFEQLENMEIGWTEDAMTEGAPQEALADAGTGLPRRFKP